MEYLKQAQDFLKNSNAKMKITFTGKAVNRDFCDGLLRNTYRVTISTPRGHMWVKFWDSKYNTDRGTKPNTYDVLACITKADPGSFENFVDEYGYTFETWEEMQQIRRIYNAVRREYNSICRCFTGEQIEELREIY